MRNVTQRPSKSVTLIYLFTVLVVDAWVPRFASRKHLQQQLLGSSSQRWALSSSTLSSAAAVLDDRARINQLVRSGMNEFGAGKVAESIRLFDEAETLQGPSLTPYLWQRGLSYYYANESELASRQFRIDVRVNPSDVEEIVWDIASQLRRNQQTGSPQQFPIPNQLSLPPGNRDRRRIMVRFCSLGMDMLLNAFLMVCLRWSSSVYWSVGYSEMTASSIPTLSRRRERARACQGWT
jgi:hypothetical protein